MNGDDDARAVVTGVLSEILTVHFGVPSSAIAAEAGIEDLGLDSVDVIEVMIMVEAQLGMDLEANGALDIELSTVGGVLDALVAAVRGFR